MPVSLNMDTSISLSKETPAPNRICIGIGYELRSDWLNYARSSGISDDMAVDTSAFMLDQKGVLLDIDHFIFYNNLKSKCGSLIHSGDNGDPDNKDYESLQINIDNIPLPVKRIVFCLSIHEAEDRFQNFSQFRSVYIRVVNMDNNNELLRLDLSDFATIHTAIKLGEIFRRNGEWRFQAIDKGRARGLTGLVQQFGGHVDS